MSYGLRSHQILTYLSTCKRFWADVCFNLSVLLLCMADVYKMWSVIVLLICAPLPGLFYNDLHCSESSNVDVGSSLHPVFAASCCFALCVQVFLLLSSYCLKFVFLDLSLLWFQIIFSKALLLKISWLSHELAHLQKCLMNGVCPYISYVLNGTKRANMFWFCFQELTLRYGDVLHSFFSICHPSVI